MGLAILFCATLALIAMDGAEQISTRIFFGLFAIGISIILLYAYRKETMLAHDHMIGTGIVTATKTRPKRRQMIKYRFVALNGMEYTGKSDWERGANVGTEIVVVYNPLQPTANRPLRRFLFYSFQAYGS